MWSTPRVWDGLRAHFEALGHATSAPMLPLHDRRCAMAPPEGIAALGVEDYANFLIADARGAPSPPVIVGHSMGSMLAQVIAARVQARALVLLSPAATTTTARFGIDPLRTMAGVMTSGKWWKNPTCIDRERALWGIFNTVPPEVAEAEVDALVWDSGRVLFQTALPWADKSKATTVDYAKLTMPALVVVGEEDRTTPVSVARATARALTGAVEYRELPGVGHWVFHELVVGKITKLIDDFLKPLSGSTAPTQPLP